MYRVVSFISAGTVLLVLLSSATLPSSGRGDPFVALRTATVSRTFLCWAIKLSPTAYVTDADCVRSYRKHQIVMIYGDITPNRTVQERLGRKVAGLRQAACRHRVPSLMLVGDPDGTNRSVLHRSVRNFIASYGMLQTRHQRSMTCRECQVLAIRRTLPCPVTPGTTALLYTACLKQIDALEKGFAAKSRASWDTWVWKLRRKLKATLYANLERFGRERLEMLNFMTGTRR
uniref:Uncharacterized protein n=1 Tax=Anopheles epiroticus TaxID=199890 RepID=A0A240PNC3_9DIPT